MELHDTSFEGIIISMVFVIRIVQDISTKRAILVVFFLSYLPQKLAIGSLFLLLQFCSSKGESHERSYVIIISKGEFRSV